MRTAGWERWYRSQAWSVSTERSPRWHSTGGSIAVGGVVAFEREITWITQIILTEWEGLWSTEGAVWEWRALRLVAVTQQASRRLWKCRGVFAVVGMLGSWTSLWNCFASLISYLEFQVTFPPTSASQTFWAVYQTTLHPYNQICIVIYYQYKSSIATCLAGKNMLLPCRPQFWEP